MYRMAWLFLAVDISLIIILHTLSLHNQIVFVRVLLIHLSRRLTATHLLIKYYWYRVYKSASGDLFIRVAIIYFRFFWSNGIMMFFEVVNVMDTDIYIMMYTHFRRFAFNLFFILPWIMVHLSWRIVDGGLRAWQVRGGDPRNGGRDWAITRLHLPLSRLYWIKSIL